MNGSLECDFILRVSWKDMLAPNIINRIHFVLHVGFTGNLLDKTRSGGLLQVESEPTVHTPHSFTAPSLISTALHCMSWELKNNLILCCSSVTLRGRRWYGWSRRVRRRQFWRRRICDDHLCGQLFFHQ